MKFRIFAAMFIKKKRLDFFRRISTSPNPFTDIIKLDCDCTSHGTYQLSNVLGQVMQCGVTEKASQALRETTIQTVSLPPGIYFLTVICGEQRKVFKVVKG